MDFRWQMRFLRMAAEVASWSKDPSTPVGAVIVKADRTEYCSGYNGPPRNLDDFKWQTGERERRISATIHAERNAFHFCRFDTVGGWMFLYGLFPCAPCAADIVQRGISTVVGYREQAAAERWNPALAMEILKDGGVEVILHNLKGGES